MRRMEKIVYIAAARADAGHHGIWIYCLLLLEEKRCSSYHSTPRQGSQAMRVLLVAVWGF